MNSFHCQIDLRLVSATKSLEKTSQSNDQEGTRKNQQWLIEMPEDLDISPALIFRYLGEKFPNISNNQNEDVPRSYFIRPEQATISLPNMIHFNGTKRMISPFDDSLDNSNSPSEVSFFTKQEPMCFFFYLIDFKS
jgi:hypothetical protein